jgi:two-component system, sensor histidine kinase PdtaS
LKTNELTHSFFLKLFLLAISLLLSTGIHMLQAQDSVNSDFSRKLKEAGTTEKKVELYLSRARRLASKPDGYFNAGEYADTALTIARNANSKHAEMLCLNTLGTISSKNAFYDDALSYYNQALSMSIQLNETEERPFIYNNIAYIMRHSGNYAEAVKILLLGLKVAEAQDNKKAAAYLLNGLGGGYLMMNDYDKALVFYAKALVPANEMGNKRSKAMNYAGMGEAYFRKKMYAEAENYYQQSLAINKEISDTKGIAIAYQGLANFFFDQNRYSLAERNYKLALAFAEKSKSKYYTAEIALDLAKTHLSTSKFQRAERHINKALMLAEEINSNQDKSKAYELLAVLYEKKGLYREAYSNILKHNELKDSILSHEIEKSVLSAQLKYDLERSREQIEELEKESLAQIERERIKLFAVGISALALIIIVVAVLLFRSVKQKEKTNITLKQLLKKNEILLSEMHHRIKNNFAVIIGLLRLQKKDLDKKPGIVAVEDTINRIYTYAAIHEQAYGKKDYSRINIGKFIKELAQKLREKSNRQLVEIVLQIEPVYPDLSTAISLALFSNEILSNAFEHGFGENDSGLLEIRLANNNNMAKLSISNTGKKPADDFNINTVDSAGLHIAKLYAGQLNGDFSYNADKQEFLLTFKFDRKSGGPLKMSNFNKKHKP